MSTEQEPAPSPQLPAEVREAIRATWGVGAITEERLARALAPFFASPQPSGDCVEKVAEEIRTALRMQRPYPFAEKTDAEVVAAILRKHFGSEADELRRRDEEIARLNKALDGEEERAGIEISKRYAAEAKLRCADDVFTKRSFPTGQNLGDELVANLVRLFSERDTLRAEVAALKAEVDGFKNNNRFMRGHSYGYKEAEEKFAAQLAASEQRLKEADEDGVGLIAAERARQISQEGWTPEHDDKHDIGQLAMAAACYAMPSFVRDSLHAMARLWPWAREWWKPTPNDRIRELTKAGALIAAEIDRRNRSASSTPSTGGVKP